MDRAKEGQRKMLDASSYTIGWVCALPSEYVAAQAFLDEEHDDADYEAAEMDNNSYTFGRMGKHNVVIVIMPKGVYGHTSAATVARDMIRSFPKLRIGLMVGIAGGAPSTAHDIRLGDVVVSSPTSDKGGVYQYDYGKTVQEKKFQHTGHLNSPPDSLLTAVADLDARIQAKGHDIEGKVETILSQNPRLRRLYGRPDAKSDRLYVSSFVHKNSTDDCEETCAYAAGAVRPRVQRDEHEDNPLIHYGLIASGNQLMKDAMVRDALVDELDVLCFEMEAAGLMKQFPFLVVRGICDYADSHKNEKWQGYAAMTAAAYARLLLGRLSAGRVVAERPLCDILTSIEQTVSATYKTSQRINDAVEKEAITRWLSAPGPSLKHKEALDEKEPATGLWCLESTQYREWKAKNKSCLWLHGIPGCGKTFLSSTIIQDLQQSGYTVVYFYFEFSDESKQSFDAMLRSLIWQLYGCSEESSSHLRQLYHDCGNGKNQPLRKSLIKTFERMAHEVEGLKIVLDALDESSTVRQVLAWLSSAGPKTLQMLLTSRETDEIKSSLTDWLPSTAIMRIQPVNVNEDIRSLVRSKILAQKQFQRRWQNVPSVVKRIETELVEKADGMFLWAACQIDPLLRCRDLPSLNKALSSLPKGLENTYQRLLTNIPPQDRQKAVRLLQFLVFIKRPLRIEEAVDVIAVSPEHTPAFQKEDRITIPDEIVGFCSSLTRITTRTEYDWFIRKAETITELQLAHFSVKEYLVSDRIEDSFKHDLSPFRASAVIVEVSLAYMLTGADKTYTAKVKTELPFMVLAAGLFGDHAMLAEGDDNAQRWILKLLTERRAYEYWYTVYAGGNPCVSSSNGDKERPTPLFYASSYGLAKSVAHLTQNGADVNPRSISGGALDAASKSGHEGIVNMLLPEYAKLNSAARGIHLESALCAASLSGHKNIVETLIREGANLHAKTYTTDIALCAASEGNHVEIVELLINEGAEVDGRGHDSATALQAASDSGNLQAVKALLDNGADPNAEGAYTYGTALHAATVRGHQEIVEILLKRGASVDMQLDYSNAVYAAACCGHKNILQLLLDQGADANLRAGEWTTVLYEHAEMELDDEATPLEGAATKGYENIVEMLLANSADVNAEGGYYGTALHAAARGNYADVVKLLIREGANVNALGTCPRQMMEMEMGYCSYPIQSSPLLHAAALWGHEEIVRILLENDAIVDAFGGHFGTALQAASFAGYYNTVGILIAAGADVNAQGGHYGNALRATMSEEHYGYHIDCIAGRLEAMQLLLAHGAKW